MVDVEANRPAHVVPLPRWTVIIHAIQIVLAIIILGLSAYGVHWIAYNALIYALVVCICTFGCALYIVGSSLFLHQVYNKFIVMGLSIWMIIFWIVDLGLVANLARIWSGDGCGYYDYYGYSVYSCSGPIKRDVSHPLAKRETTTVGAYYGALCAGAFFAAMEFVSWVAILILVVLYMNKQNSAAAPAHAPPAYVNDTQNAPAVPMEKYNYTQQQQPQQPQQPYSQVSSPAPQPAVPQQQQPGQFVQPPQPPYPQYPQDPIGRGDTVSPVSNPGGYVTPQHGASELVSPQATGSYNPNVSELSTNPNVTELSNNHNVPELADKK